jgi:hypothetical protein
MSILRKVRKQAFFASLLKDLHASQNGLPREDSHGDWHLKESSFNRKTGFFQITLARKATAFDDDDLPITVNLFKSNLPLKKSLKYLFRKGLCRLFTHGENQELWNITAPAEEEQEF